MFPSGRGPSGTHGSFLCHCAHTHIRRRFAMTCKFFKRSRRLIPFGQRVLGNAWLILMSLCTHPHPTPLCYDMQVFQTKPLPCSLRVEGYQALFQAQQVLNQKEKLTLPTFIGRVSGFKSLHKRRISFFRLRARITQPSSCTSPGGASRRPH